MPEESCCGPGCGCNTDSLYSEKDCPVCGRRLRITGNMQQMKLKLHCPDCGYLSQQLSFEELAELIG